MRTKNIKFCAYLKMYGYEVMEAVIISRGKAEYVFDISKEEFDKLKISFNQSKYLTYANALDSIKDLAYE